MRRCGKLESTIEKEGSREEPQQQTHLASQKSQVRKTKAALDATDATMLVESMSEK